MIFCNQKIAEIFLQYYAMLFFKHSLN